MCFCSGRSDIGIIFLSYAVIEATKQKATRCIERIAAAVSLDRAYNFPVIFAAKKVGPQGKAAKLRDIANLYNRSRPEPLEEVIHIDDKADIVREIQEFGFAAHTFEVRDRRSLDRFAWEELWI